MKKALKPAKTLKKQRRGRENFINKKGLFYAKFFEFEEFSIEPFFCSSIKPQQAVRGDEKIILRIKKLYMIQINSINQ